MDFSNALDGLESFAADPQGAWVDLATRALGVAKVEIEKSTSSDKDHSIVTQLRDFLHEVAQAFNANPPPILGSGTAATRFRTLEEYVGRQNSKMLAERIAAQIGTSERLSLQQIEISNSGLVKIHSLLGELRRSVDALDLAEKKKQALHAKLDGFERQLVSRAMSSTQVFAILAFVGAAVAGTTSTLADGPDAIETIGKITAYLGVEKQLQEEAATIAAEIETKSLPSPEDFEPENSEGKGVQ